jgi:ATP-dependent DNA helicase RecG
MTDKELYIILKGFISLPAETEWLEFKEAKNNFDFDDLGKYFAALSNEANLKGQEFGWLIFGVKDNPKSIVGSNYRANRAILDKLKSEIANHTNGYTFQEIFELTLPEGRVVMFQIPAAPRGIPVTWKGHFYGRNAESLSGLSISEIEQIRSQVIRYDWSEQIIEQATLEDLDSEAILKARQEYKLKYPGRAKDVDVWDDLTFLNKAKVTIQGKITNAAIILLGKEEATHWLNPFVCRMTWLRNDNSNYLHFDCPFLLNTERLLSQISNPIYRYLPDNTLFPREVRLYDGYVIREALHNCIAHQDYTKQERIMVIETHEDNLLFINAGSFLPQTVENVIEQDAPQAFYRNKFLTDAMVNLGMIDTIGSGIKRMFIEQKNRFFPLPDYDFSDPKHVRVRVFGKIINENFTRMLMNDTALSLQWTILLDKVQKRYPISDQDAKELKAMGLIEGRKPNYLLTSSIASLVKKEAHYIQNRGFDKIYYQDLIIQYLRKFGTITREKTEELLLPKLPDILSKEQKHNKIQNLLKEMKKKEILVREGSKKTAKWYLNKGKIKVK